MDNNELERVPTLLRADGTSVEPNPEPQDPFEKERQALKAEISLEIQQAARSTRMFVHGLENTLEDVTDVMKEVKTLLRKRVRYASREAMRDLDEAKTNVDAHVHRHVWKYVAGGIVFGLLAGFMGGWSANED